MHPTPGKFALNSDVTLQTRRAQSVNPQLADAIQCTCEANQQIVACYLLDARKPETGEIGFIIAVTLAAKTESLDSVAQQFQEMLRHFPIQARNTIIMSSEIFTDRHAGTEFYAKNGA